jgi:hypothetical protein
MRPSFLGLVMSGLLILVALVLLAVNAWSLRGRDWVFVAIFLSIAVSVHSMLHAHEERWYRFNPMRGQWNI